MNGCKNYEFNFDDFGRFWRDLKKSLKVLDQQFEKFKDSRQISILPVFKILFRNLETLKYTFANIIRNSLRSNKVPEFPPIHTGNICSTT
jgi:hypothetical protein